MTAQVIKAEVRLYFNGRSDWDTEFFDASCATDVMAKATAIAKAKGADHFNCSRATAEDEYKHSGPTRRPKLQLLGTMKDQVAAIESITGMEAKKSRTIL